MSGAAEADTEAPTTSSPPHPQTPMTPPPEPTSPTSPESEVKPGGTGATKTTRRSSRRNSTPVLRGGGDHKGGGGPKGALGATTEEEEEEKEKEKEKEEPWEDIDFSQLQRSRSFAQINGRFGSRSGSEFEGEQQQQQQQRRRQEAWHGAASRKGSVLDAMTLGAGEDQFVLRMTENHHGNHHKFAKVSLAKVVKCYSCTWFIWGFVGSAVACKGMHWHPLFLP